MRDRRHTFNKRTFYKKRRFERWDSKIGYAKKHRRFSKPAEHQVLESFFAAFWQVIKWPFLRYRHQKTKLKELDKNKVKERWSIVEDLYNRHDFRATIIEADKIMEYTLEHMNFEGDNYAMRLKSAQVRLSPSIFNSLWEARRSRNRAVHEMEAEITSFEAKSVKDKIERGLKELGVLC